MGTPSNISTTLAISAARILLIVVAAEVIFAACSEDTPKSALADEAYAVLDALTTQYSPREVGSVQETRAALHLQDRLDATGYDTSRQGFGTSSTHQSSYMFYADPPMEPGEGGASLEPIRPHLHPGPVFSPPRGFATGPLTPVGDTSQLDLPDPSLEGRIALIMPGTMTDDGLIRRVTRAGAVGAIIISNAEDDIVEEDITFPITDDIDPFSASPEPRIITVVSIGMAKGNALLELIERGDVTVSIKTDVTQGPVWNVVAHKPGNADDPPQRVILGAHYDTVEDTQGASDNGSGMAALLTVATHIAERDYPFEVQIVLFGAQKQGLLGSEHYVENMSPDEIAGTIAMLNFDALGSGTKLHAIGDYNLTTEAVRVGREPGMNISIEGRRMFGSSDHAPFEKVGIPTLSLSSNDLSRNSSPEDTIEHINPDLLGYAAEIGIAMLDSLAEEVR